MQITIEISYYALTGDYAAPVKDFLERLSQYKMIRTETGNMSTITGDDGAHIPCFYSDHFIL